MTHLLRIARGNVAPEVSRPDPAKVVSGDPVHSAWDLETRDLEGRGNIYAGLWHSTVGEWRCDYAEWEYVHILEGVSVLTDEAGVATTLKAGDSYVIRPGFRGTWRVVEPTLKDYVIVT